MTPSEQEQGQVDALLASYGEKKNEISRRSSLSWAAVAGYSVFFYYAWVAVGDGKHKLAWPVGCWLLSALTYIFVFSQYSVIMAISEHIKLVIEPRLAVILASSGGLLGEGSESENYYGRTLKLLDGFRILLVAVFLFAPLLLDVFAIYEGGPCLWLNVTSATGSAVLISMLLGLKMSPP